MQNSRIRQAMAVAALSGAALASSLALAGPARADAVYWNCTSVSAVNSSGVASGMNCTPTTFSGNLTGAGYLVVNGVTKAQCTGFNYVPGTKPGYWEVFGNGCV